jgi:signal recognition particle subunit SRP54
MPGAEEMAKLAEKLPGGLPTAMPGAPGKPAPGLPPNFPGLPGGLPTGVPGLGTKFPGNISGSGKKK